MLYRQQYISKRARFWTMRLPIGELPIMMGTAKGAVRHRRQANKASDARISW